MDIMKLREYEGLSPFEIKDFLAKAASRALMAEALFPFAPAFSNACRDTLHAVNTLGVNSGIGMLHPTLYAMEGAVADRASNEAAFIALMQMLPLARKRM